MNGQNQHCQANDADASVRTCLLPVMHSSNIERAKAVQALAEENAQLTMYTYEAVKSLLMTSSTALVLLLLSYTVHTLWHVHNHMMQGGGTRAVTILDCPCCAIPPKYTQPRLEGACDMCTMT